MNLTEAKYIELLARGTVREVGTPHGPPSLSAESEHHFLARILALAKQHGWLSYHTHDSRKSAPGFPDIVVVKPPSVHHKEGRLVFAELKTRTGKLTAAQHQWISILHTVQGIDCYVWRPQDWDTIVDILTSTDGLSVP